MDSIKQKRTLSTPVQYLPGVGPDRAALLAKLEVRTAQDLLFLFPRDYEFPAPPASVDALAEGRSASLVGTITDAELVSRTPGKSLFAAIVENETGSVRIVFFNQPFRAEQLLIDRRVMISGAPKLRGLRWEFMHPQVTILDNSESIPEPRILPIYPLTAGIKQAELRRITYDTMNDLADSVTEVMPDELRERSTQIIRSHGIGLDHPLPGIASALRNMHAPQDASWLNAARTRLVFQELLVMQLAFAIRRRQLQHQQSAPSMKTTAMIDARIVHRFPFELTADQRNAIDEIRADMAKPFPMNRLLQGDVGSGKTVVAVYAMMLAVASGYQAVLMAPTEVLARQHDQTLRRMLAGSRVRIGLLCGSLTASERRNVLKAAAEGEVDVVIGTQALLYGDIEFQRLGLVVIDEQHKFGVAQRVALKSGELDPHYLVMSATPIPRSIALTVFGDTDLSTLRERPPGRATVKTYLAKDEWKERWWAFVREQLNQGRQAFVVAPRVWASQNDSLNEIETKSETEESIEDLSAIDNEPTEAGSDLEASGNASDANDANEDVASVESVFEDLCNGPLAEYRIGLLHGRMPNEEKQAVMEAFASGRIQVLVSTTVIEVGIDVPNATVMTILGAQRFGLAQLHQLRGRVGRGVHQGHVCVFSDGQLPPQEHERLKIFEQTEDGFELAEADFALRGPGDLLGQAQSGIPRLRIADLQRDQATLAAARQQAQELVVQDGRLDEDALSGLRHQVMRRYGKRLDLADGT